MPSPVGHALGGLAVGYLAGRRPADPLIAVCAFAAALPDADFLLPMLHRGPSHSVGAAVLIGTVALLWVRLVHRGRDAGRVSTAIAVAYATHVLFDWLGADSSTPRGLMALWPLSSSFFISDVDLFNSVDRRYWLDGFWRRNTVALVRELIVLGPLVAAAWLINRHRARPQAVNLRRRTR